MVYNLVRRFTEHQSHRFLASEQNSRHDPKMKLLVVLCALALVAAEDVKKSEDKKVTKRSHYFDHEYNTLGGLYNGGYGLSTSTYAAGIPYISGSNYASGFGLGSANTFSSALSAATPITSSASGIAATTLNAAPAILTGNLGASGLASASGIAGGVYAPAYEPYYIGKKYHTTVTNEVAVPVPQPVAVPVEVEKQVPVPVPHPYAVPVDKPYPVPVPVEKQVPVPVPQPYPVPYPKEVPVPVPQPYSVPVDRPVPVPYEKPYAVPVPHAVPVAVEKQVPVPVPQPYPVEVPKPYPVHHAVPVPVPQPVAVPQPVPVPQPVAVSQPVAVAAQPVTVTQQYALQPVATITQPLTTVQPFVSAVAAAPIGALSQSIATLPQSYSGLRTFPGSYGNFHHSTLAGPYSYTRGNIYGGAYGYGTYGKPYASQFLANSFTSPINTGFTKYNTGFDYLNVVKK